MPRRLPPYVNRQTARGGQTYLYFRKGKGERIRLPADPASPAFAEAYAAALAGKTEKPVLPSHVKGTLAALIADYIASGDYKRLRDTTKQGYMARLEILRTSHGHRTLSGMTRAGVQQKILDPYGDRPGAANALLKILRVLVRFAMVRDMLIADPTQGLKLPKLGKVHTWTEEEIAQFEAKWPVGTRERLAFALHLFTGQRRSDIHKMTWANVSTGKVALVQQKTGERVCFPIHRDLAAILAATPREHVTILNTTFGKPFTVTGISRMMRAAITAAGLSLPLRPHGLRKAAGRRLAEAGCVPHEIMAILGHVTLSEAQRYTADADRERLGSSAIHKLERGE